MCFKVEPKNNKVLIATKDIPCWKMVIQKSKALYKSYWQEFEYQAGFHYYNENFPEKVNAYQGLSNEGIHSFTRFDRADPGRNEYGRVILECTIPKGSRYLINEYDQEYISSDLIVVRKVRTR